MCLNLELCFAIWCFVDEEWGSPVPALAQRKEHILLFQTNDIQGKVTLHIHWLPSYASCAGFRVPRLVSLEIVIKITSAQIVVSRVREDPQSKLFHFVKHQIKCMNVSVVAHSNGVKQNG